MHSCIRPSKPHDISTHSSRAPPRPILDELPRLLRQENTVLSFLAHAFDPRAHRDQFDPGFIAIASGCSLRNTRFGSATDKTDRQTDKTDRCQFWKKEEEKRRVRYDRGATFLAEEV